MKKPNGLSAQPPSIKVQVRPNKPQIIQVKGVTHSGTSIANKHLEQKTIDTSIVYGEEFEEGDSLIFTETVKNIKGRLSSETTSNLQTQAVNLYPELSLQKKPSSNSGHQDLQWGKENIIMKKELEEIPSFLQAAAQNGNQLSSGPKPQPSQVQLEAKKSQKASHTRTLSANIPYVSRGMNTTNSVCMCKQPFSSNNNNSSQCVYCQKNTYQSYSVKKPSQPLDDEYDFIEEEEDQIDEGLGMENLAEEEEMTLGNFYADLENKQPLLTKYSSQELLHDDEDQKNSEDPMSIQKEKSEAQSSNAKMTSSKKEYETASKAEQILAKQFEELAIITPMSKEKKQSEERKTNQMQQSKQQSSSSSSSDEKKSTYGGYIQNKGFFNFFPNEPDEEEEKNQKIDLEAQNSEIYLEDQQSLLLLESPTALNPQQLEDCKLLESDDLLIQVEPIEQQPDNLYTPQQQFQMLILEQMLLRDQEYRNTQMNPPSQNAMLVFDCQKQIQSKMREILIDWMMEVCEEFMIKRETLYVALNYIDRYLCMADYEIPKVELQLIGVTSLFLASKVEEVYVSRLADFAEATAGGYTKDQILEMEFLIMKNIRYKLHPITLCTWANWYINMWDVYADTTLRQYYGSGQDLTFKSPNETAYQRLRVFFQLLDLITLTAHVHYYCPRQLIGAMLYLIVGGPHLMAVFPYELKWYPTIFAQDLPIYCTPTRPYIVCSSAQFNIDQVIMYNQIFEDFLVHCFGFNLTQIAGPMQYVLPFFGLPLSFELPRAATNPNSGLIIQNNYEEFLGFQTHNKSALQYIKEIRR